MFLLILTNYVIGRSYITENAPDGYDVDPSYRLILKAPIIVNAVTTESAVQVADCVPHVNASDTVIPVIAVADHDVSDDDDSESARYSEDGYYDVDEDDIATQQREVML